MKQTALFSIGWKDFGKGLLIAFFTPILPMLYVFFNSGNIPNVKDIKIIVLAGVSSIIGYLIKNFFTNSNNELLKKENP